MSKIKIEAFLSSTPDAKDDNLLKLLKEIGQEYNEKVEIIINRGWSELYKEYNLSALPALIVDDLIRFIGVCPDKETVLSALKESGID